MLGVDGVGEGDDRVVVGDVEGARGEHGAACGADPLGGLGQRHVLDVGQHQPRAAVGKRQRCRPADPAGRAGDETGRALDLHAPSTAAQSMSGGAAT